MLIKMKEYMNFIFSIIPPITFLIVFVGCYFEQETRKSKEI